MKQNASVEEKFDGWFVKPIKLLKDELPEGDGGFVAFMAALALYERLIIARLKISKLPTDETSIKQEMSRDLGLPDYQRQIFWDMFRNGLLHQAMPKAGKTNYFFSDQYSGYPEFKTAKGCTFICMDPWKFTDRVLQEYLSNPRLIIESNSFPIAAVTTIKFDE
jgi:hypothetical protein